MELQKIIQQIISGELTRDIDEKHAGGFWDLSAEMIPLFDETDEDIETYNYHQEQLYNTLWEIVETLINKDTDTDTKRYYLNENDGHTYWLENNKLMSAPTFKDGSIDKENIFDVLADYDMPLTQKEFDFIISKLTN